MTEATTSQTTSSSIQTDGSSDSPGGRARDEALDPSKSRPAVWIPIGVAILTVLGGTGWLQFFIARSDKQRAAEDAKNALAQSEAASSRAAHERWITDHLRPMTIALNDTKVAHDDMYRNDLVEGWGILESYVKKVQKDGYKKHALMRKRIEFVVRANEKVITLLDGYLPHALTDGFRVQAAEFRDHALRYSDRWAAVPDVIGTKEQLPVAKPFPTEFPAQVAAEIEAQRRSESSPTAK